MKKLRVLVVPSDRTGVSHFRSTNPHLALENNYPDDFHVDIDYEPELNNDAWLKQYDIIHYHRTLGPYENMKSLLARLNDLNIVTIMDIDDYWEPGNHHPAYELIKSSGLDAMIKRNIVLAENVTTTTPIFADEIKPLNKSVFVLPNAINPNEEQFKPKLEPSDKIRIGWLGGSSHRYDLEILNGLVSKLQTAGLLDKIQFVLCGFDTRGSHTTIDPVTKQQTVRAITPKESVWYTYERIFTDDYRIVSPEYKEYLMKFTQEEYPNVHNEPYRRVWTKHISTYATNYNLFDISLAPIEEHIFNKCKSQLKVIEAGFHNKAIIAQNYGPYQIDLTNAIEYGGIFNNQATGILVDTNKNHSDWFNAIKKLIKNPEMITTLQNNLSAKIKDIYSIDNVTKQRKELYQRLVSEKQSKKELEYAKEN
jgi:glycosyltransferase involved in cell wall biosynthesis